MISTLETVVEGLTGVFFDEPNDEALAAAVEKSEQLTWQPARIRQHAEQFSERCFLEKMDAVLLDQ